MNQNYQTLLLKFSLIISFSGILLLLFLSSQEPNLKQIKDIQNLTENQLVKIQGNITNSKEISSFFILTLEDASGKIEILSEKNFPINKTIEVLGKIRFYKNQMQIRAERIRRV